MSEHRDEELGRALRDLPVPEHRPGFAAELRARLEAEAPDGAQPAPAVRRRRPLSRWVPAVAAAVALILAGTWLARPDGTGPVRPPVALAEVVKTKVSAAMASARTIRGRIEGRSWDPGTKSITEDRGAAFVATAAGDFRQEGEEDVIAYDASEGVERGCFGEDGTILSCGERVGLAPAQPDQGPAEWLLRRHLGSVVRALLAAEDPAVEETTVDGRPAWRLETDVRPNLLEPDLTQDHMEIVVDQETGFPVHTISTYQGDFRREWRLLDLVVDGPVQDGEFTVEFPGRVERHRIDEGFRRVPIEQVRAEIGREPLVPALPEGFTLAEVAVSRRPTTPFTGTEGGNPESRDVVSMVWTRGFDRVAVTARARTPGEWTDPLSTGEGYVDEHEEVRLTRGALAGAAANLLIDPLNVPHVWILGEDVVVTIAGDLSRAELIAAAESLAPRA